MLKRLTLLGVVLITACRQEQPSVTTLNAATDRELTAIAANTSNVAGAAKPGQIAPTVGQRLDAKSQPPKSQ